MTSAGVGRPARGRGPWVVLAFTAVALAAWAAWRAPVSPLALWRAEVLLASSEPAFAAAHLEAAGRSNPIAAVRLEAQRRCAAVWWQAARDGVRARSCLELLAADPAADASTRAWAFAALAAHLEGPLQDAGQAAAAWAQAYELARKDPEAGDRLEHQARALERAGQPEEAQEVWRKVALRFPERKARARVAQGDVLLALGASRQACEAYGDALEADPEPDVAELAQRGHDVCQTRQDNLQRAMALSRKGDIPEELKRRLEGGGADGGRD